MNKSTSLEQLNNEESAQNDLVNEILNEINGANSKMENMQQQQPQQPQQPNQSKQPPQQQPQPEPEPQENEQLTQNEEAQMEMNIENMLKDDSTEHFQDETTEVSNISKPSVLNMLKKPLVVGLLVALFSLPFVNTGLLKVLPKKEFIVNNSTVFTTLLKFLVSAILYFSLERVW
tara:strand:+ start:197 stop:721 length:525 start_codon:yes stop_codon:yes gene_type:complete